MAQSEIEELRERVVRLEGKIALLKARPIAADVKEFVVPKELEVQKLTLVDKQGNPRIKLDASEAPFGIALFDEDSNLRLNLTVEKLGAAVQFFDDEGSLRITIAAGYQGRAELTLSSNEMGSPAELAIQDDKGMNRATLTVDYRAKPAFILRDEKGRPASGR